MSQPQSQSSQEKQEDEEVTEVPLTPEERNSTIIRIIRRVGQYLVFRCRSKKEADEDEPGEETHLLAALDLSSPTPKLTTIFEQFKSQITERICELLGQAEPNEEYQLVLIGFRQQNVAGVDYFMKVKYENQYFHVRVYESLQGDHKLQDVCGPKGENDKVEYF